jgi:hypothetical protein
MKILNKEITAPDGPDVLQAYTASVRALAAHIDLKEIWEPFKDDPEPFSISDIATLYWEGEIDASRWIALHLHLEDACPYFEDRGNNTYRAQEELRQLDRLHYRHERYLLLKHLSASAGRTFSATVLHLRRDGALVELVDLPLKTVVRPYREVSVGEVIRLRLTGVDLWRSEAHLAVQ